MFKLNRRANSTEHFEPIHIGTFTVSIQAGARLHSFPRIDLPSSDDYTQFEVAIYDAEGEVQPLTDPRFSERGWVHYFEKEVPWAEYVPREVVEQILADLDAASV
jgi:hypothetical protein